MANNSVNSNKYKVVFLGDQSVGKTSIINRFIYETFDDKGQPTVGIDFISKNINIDNQQVRLQIWDTAGQERFRSLIPNYLRNVNAAILVFDLSNRESFESISKWLEDIKQQSNSTTVIALVGSKVDLKDQRKVNHQEAIDFAQIHNLIYIETSSKLAYNISHIFYLVTAQLLGLDYNTLSILQTHQINQQSQKQPNQIQLQKPYNSNTNQKKKCC